MKTILFIVSTTVLHASFSCAQPVVPAKARQAMSRLVGTWHSAGKSGGEPFQDGSYSATWNEAKTGLLVTVDNPLKGVYHAVQTWDFAKQQLVENWICPDGRRSEFRFTIIDDDHWKGNVETINPDGTVTGGKIELTFDRDAFEFNGDFESGQTRNTRSVRWTPQEAEQTFRDWADFVVGGTWVNETDGKISEHTYTWRPGHKKTLQLDRKGVDYPGVSLVAVDHQTNHMTWLEVDDDGLMGGATMTRLDQDRWKYNGAYHNRDRDEEMMLIVRRAGPNEIVIDEGYVITNGQKQSRTGMIWKRR